MPRSSNVVASRKRKKKILKQTKGYFGARKNVYTVAKNAIEKGLQYSYRDRRKKKSEFRGLWIQRINAAAREHNMSYSEFIGKLNKHDIQLNRKVLADLAMNHPDAFSEVVKIANSPVKEKKTETGQTKTAEKPVQKKETKSAKAEDKKPAEKKEETPKNQEKKAEATKPSGIEKEKAAAKPKTEAKKAETKTESAEKKNAADKTKKDAAADTTKDEPKEAKSKAVEEKTPKQPKKTPADKKENETGDSKKPEDKDGK